ncbi:hypothetical protein CSA37_07955 [Candidatus Fermentibacteria bacterium]|nr:MAG: hypothetical protein CSA37_07955 [Candidatus Fermentibacteria bacterium]
MSVTCSYQVIFFRQLNFWFAILPAEKSKRGLFSGKQMVQREYLKVFLQKHNGKMENSSSN